MMTEHHANTGARTPNLTIKTPECKPLSRQRPHTHKHTHMYTHHTHTPGVDLGGMLRVLQQPPLVVWVNFASHVYRTSVRMHKAVSLIPTQVLCKVTHCACRTHFSQQLPGMLYIQHGQSKNHISLIKQTKMLCSHPLCRTRFSQYQTCFTFSMIKGPHVPYKTGLDASLQKKVGCYNHRVVTLVVVKLRRQWL